MLHTILSHIQIQIIVKTLVVLAAAWAVACQSSADPKAFQRVITHARFVDRTSEPFGIAEKDGDLYVSDGQHGRILKISAWPDRSVFADGLDTPSGVAFDSKGNLFVADSGSSTIQIIGPNRTTNLFAGVPNIRGSADGTASSATFNSPVGIAVDVKGTIYVSDTYNDRIRIIENGVVRTLAGGIKGFADGPAGDARFDTPLGIALWKDRLLVADAGNRRIRVVENDGSVWTLAGNGNDDSINGPLLNAGFSSPTSVGVDPKGIIYVADGNLIRAIGRRVFPFVETVAGGRRGFRNAEPRGSLFDRVSGLVVMRSGDLAIADSGNELVRKMVVTEEQQNEKIGSAPLRRYTAEEFRLLQPARWPFESAYSSA